MRIITILITVTGLLFSCGAKEKSDGINLLVTDKSDTDTIGFSYYENQILKKYHIYDTKSNLDEVISDKKTLSRINGYFAFGIKKVDDPLTSWLVYGGISPKRFELTNEPQTPFLDEEFKLKNEYRVVMTTHYFDSTGIATTKVEVLAAIDKHTQDTILFQDAIYAFKNKDKDEVILTLVVYRDNKTREEMRMLIADAADKMKKSTLDTLNKVR